MTEWYQTLNSKRTQLQTSSVYICMFFLNHILRLSMQVGQIVSHYKILQHLDNGGMAVVSKAQDLILYRPIALKFSPSELTRAKDNYCMC